MRVDRVTDTIGSGSSICRSVCLLMTLALLCGLVSGCRTLGLGRKTVVYFTCGPEINNGLILAAELIWATETEKRTILAIGPDRWWSSDHRRGLTEPHLTHIDLRGGQREQVNLRRPNGAVVLIVFADYGGVTDPNAQQLVIAPRGIVRAQRVRIRVGEDRLELIR